MGKLSQIGTAYAAERTALTALRTAEAAERDGRLGAGGVITARRVYEAAQAATLAANQAFIDDPEDEEAPE